LVDFGNPTIKFQENPSVGNRVVPCGRTITKLTGAFRNFANAPKCCILLKVERIHENGLVNVYNFDFVILARDWWTDAQLKLVVSSL